MTAAKVMDIISRLPGCAGQAADAVSVFSQVKMEYAPKLLKIPGPWHPGREQFSHSKGKWPPRGTGNRQAPPFLEVRPGNRQGWWKRSKLRWNGRQLTLDKTVGSRVWWHTQGSSGRPASDLGWGSSSTTAPGSLSTGSPTGRTPPHGDGSMYSQANVRAGKVLRSPPRALQSVIVDTEKVLREVDGPMKRAVLRPAMRDGWKGDRPWVRLETEQKLARSPKITSAMSGNFIYRHDVEPRVKLYSPREESFPIPLKYIDVSRTTRSNLDVKQDRRIDDYWNIDGPGDLSDSWTGFTQFTLLKQKTPQMDMCGAGRDPGQIIYGQNSGRKWERRAKLKERQKWSNEEPKFGDARRLRGIYFIDPEDKEFKETIRNAGNKLETSVASAMPCKISKNNQKCGNGDKSNKIQIKTCVYFGSQWIYKAAYGRIFTESSWRPYCRKRGTIHCSITIWYTNLFLCLKPWKFSQQGSSG